MKKRSLADLEMIDKHGLNLFPYVTENFKYAVNIVLKHEGGFSNNKNDAGGATNYGISLRFLKSMGIDINHDGTIDIEDIQAIQKDNAIEIYKTFWWDKYHYEAINSCGMATKIFDMAVNMGASQAHKIVQRACKWCGHSELVADGILGAKSLAAINEINLHGRDVDLIHEIVVEQKTFYESLVEKNPHLEIFLKGWLNRASWMPDV